MIKLKKKIKGFSLIFQDVPTWLKNLRLHKYTQIFCRINYDQMTELTEQYLGQEGVTKGARDKILLQIRKLKDRSKRIIQLKHVSLALCFA